jgi:hypothetical protein
MRKRDLLSAAVGAVVATALAGGIALAAIPGAGGVIDGCYQKNQGQLRVIDPGSDGCRASEVAIAWNGQGLQGEPGRDGRDGTSVTVTAEAPGVNCPAGGVKITAVNGAAYVCNAMQGVPPDPGPDFFRR